MPQQSAPHPTDLVVFGGTGDLSMRKLLPSLYLLDRDGHLDGGTRVVAVSRDGLTDADFRDKAAAAVRGHHAVQIAEPDVLHRFLGRIHHVTVDVGGDPFGWDDLTAVLEPGRDRVFYLAVPPMISGPICRGLADAGLVTPCSRVVMEKPLGRDLASSQAVNDAVGEVFDESRIYRIDHYLGKETVQNLLVLRFANVFLEPLWNSRWIDHVQITAAETVGVGGRRGYYDTSGAMRDMVQNHLLQLLCLTAMEPPASYDRDAVRDEKLKVLQSLRPLTGDRVAEDTVRGQYGRGAVQGTEVLGYLDEPGGPATSDTETFVALRAEVANWRWAGVPFYLRTGKRMQHSRSEIVIRFREVPHTIFPGTDMPGPGSLVIRLQPDEGIHLTMLAKTPGAGALRLRPVPLELSFADTFADRAPEAYERLLTDVLAGDPTLFMRRDEVEAAWRWVDPVIEAWNGLSTTPETYPAGSAGPAGAHRLIGRTGRTWHEEERPR
ncbi:glucose-6-phosphate 1-dehydrogenase [Nocardiopsis arvandica]|uniref:Glucose-6-phosphate 1-dehydrogenase n=1 Tax=Nocardiopsis sinuspersici TaxID=501010 RepID=A0A7Z0BKV6_9ACTN|nr:glucose-6-phosphate dehydrogenase [Nocardiopsis sinuspersici]NYH52877.1 glucose-6-phosphate 1-dehydrogenase [Nocardiopsis sinuspersici]